MMPPGGSGQGILKAAQIIEPLCGSKQRLGAMMFGMKIFTCTLCGGATHINNAGVCVDVWRLGKVQVAESALKCQD